MVRALKFRGERVYARVLGTLLARARGAMQAPLPEIVVPVPLYQRRYGRRGFNQAQDIARFAARNLGVPVDSRVLVRGVETREQSGLSLAARRRNVRGAFMAVRELHGRRVALVDDVLTTGNTALAATRALIEAGASEIEVWAVARVDAQLSAQQVPRRS